ncbi:PilN domain-containing protein [Legionella londiniensis]|uniref:Fimbrial assembly protein (PilN) n=1 Tax=Legionella londiniensis TaxID=45068 RepID=A0A0W0VJC5_9GAMM|nr:PilN domain-containing protein [Legionella londiniensis]KTD19881.1 Fimbrial assembly protein (PilN) [Legionella londiniensis]STX94247.1 Fimbrial assembly protein (PilN) [Legionella londiniensis]
MTQEVNFLRSMPEAPRYLPAMWMGLGILALLLVLISISLTMGVYQFQAAQRLDEITAQREIAEKNFQKMAKAYPLLATERPLVERVTELQAKLQAKREQFKELTHATLRHPFSQYLSNLSIAVPEGLWLSTIKIDQNEKNLSLGGYSLQPVLVSIFLQNLKEAAAFKAIEFDLFYVKKVPGKNYIEFEIANKKLTNQEEDQEDKR